MSTRKYEFSFDGDSLDLPGGLHAIVKTAIDEDMGPPWEEHEGHGPVSDWVHRDKYPGERLLCSDRSLNRYYDFAEATRIAKRDGWGLCDEESAALGRRLGRKPTRKEITAEAVERDFEHLRRWANDQWHWIGVAVTLYDADDCKLGSDSLWGIEDDTDYWKDVASEMLEGLISKHDHEATERQHWAERDVITA